MNFKCNCSKWSDVKSRAFPPRHMFWLLFVPLKNNKNKNVSQFPNLVTSCVSDCIVRWCFQLDLLSIQSKQNLLRRGKQQEWMVWQTLFAIGVNDGNIEKKSREWWDSILRCCFPSLCYRSIFSSFIFIFQDVWVFIICLQVDYLSTFVVNSKLNFCISTVSLSIKSDTYFDLHFQSWNWTIIYTIFFILFLVGNQRRTREISSRFWQTRNSNKWWCHTSRTTVYLLIRFR